MTRTQRWPRGRRAGLAVTAALTLGASLAACSGAGGAGGGGGSGDTISVAMVGNPPMQALEKLTADTFTKDTGIKVRYSVLPENELRDKVTQDIATQGGQYDAVTIGAYEVSIWAKNGWLTDLKPALDGNAAYDNADVLAPMKEALTIDGKQYAAPFYGESSFLMYRKDLLAAKGLTMPANPTWQQVEQLAAKLNDKSAGVAGICLRGLPGWGEMGAPLTTMVNTFGGTWFEKDWSAKVNSPEFTAATKFYVDLVRKYGEQGAPNAGFSECLTALSQGKAAMWYDATSAAGSLEDPATSKAAGKIGYAPAPVVKTKSGGWLWTWAFAEPKTSKKQDSATKFIEWATGKDYQKLVGEKDGWAQVPSGNRQSLYTNPQYLAAAKPFAQTTLDQINGVDPANPGLQPRPAPGVQFVAIPEFADLGTKCTQELSASIAGRESVDSALGKCQSLAETVSKKYQ
jgi:sorbitol/mannitol transport system substrate-binding protein